MGASFPQSVTVPLEVNTLPLGHDELSLISCPKCQIPLSISQPDPGIPNQLMGACAGCGSWFGVWVKDEENEAVVVHLAIIDLMRAWLGLV
jgi:hypothetical protein